jgi:hypothetical protein
LDWFQRERQHVEAAVPVLSKLHVGFHECICRRGDIETQGTAHCKFAALRLLRMYAVKSPIFVVTAHSHVCVEPGNNQDAGAGGGPHENQDDAECINHDRRPRLTDYPT